MPELDIYFTDFFGVSPELLAEYGAFNVSLINDLPLFIDPFLLFNSAEAEYRALHDGMIRYLRFLRDKSVEGAVSDGLLQAWYVFSEVRETWLGFSKTGNKGSGLGMKFARALNENLTSIFSDFGDEKVARSSHLEKVCLIRSRVGRDNISDFTTNLIKEYLLNFTQAFAQQALSPNQRKKFRVKKVRFNYATESWDRGDFELPAFHDTFVILTPRDILTKDDTWINRRDLLNRYEDIAEALPDEQLRAQVNNYLYQILPKDAKDDQYKEAVAAVFRRYPELIEYYIRMKEDQGDAARSLSEQRVKETELLFIKQLVHFTEILASQTRFYDVPPPDTLAEARQRVAFLKSVIEDKDGYRLFYVDGKPIKREVDVQILFRLAWFATPSDVSPEANAGRGPVDFKVSRGSRDKTLVEFKLASNTQLKRNLQKQVAIYEKAHDTIQSLKVILFFSEYEYQRVRQILKELGLAGDDSIILIDARNDNKPSASRA